MLNVDRMRTAGNVLDAAVKGLTDEEVGRMLLIHAPGACMWVVDWYNENSKEEKETSKVDEAVYDILDLLKCAEASYEEKLIGIKVAFMFAEAAADEEQMEELLEAKKKILAGLKEEKKGE